MRTAFFMPFPGTFLTGCRGCHRFFKLSIYRCGITLKTCSTPRVYILYKNACQPRQPVKICLFSSLEGRFSCLSKRPCVQIKTHLRFKSNVLAFQVKRTCVFLPADLFKNSKWFSVGFICMGCSLRGPHFKYNNL